MTGNRHTRRFRNAVAHPGRCLEVDRSRDRAFEESVEVSNVCSNDGVGKETDWRSVSKLLATTYPRSRSFCKDASTYGRGQTWRVEFREMRRRERRHEVEPAEKLYKLVAHGL